MTNNKKSESILMTYARFSGFGIQFGMVFLAGLFGGKYLDTKLATKPLFLVVGASLGMGLGFYTLFKMLNSQQKDAAQTTSDESNNNSK